MKIHQIKEVLANLKQKISSEGEVLFRAGDIGNEFFIIIEGYVTVYVPYPEFKFSTIGGLLENPNWNPHFFDEIIRFFCDGKRLTKENFNPVKRL